MACTNHIQLNVCLYEQIIDNGNDNLTSINVGNQHIELDTHALTEYMYRYILAWPAVILLSVRSLWRIHGIHGKPVSCRCMSLEERSVCYIYISCAREQTYKYITTSMQGFRSGIISFVHPGISVRGGGGPSSLGNSVLRTEK